MYIKIWYTAGGVGSSFEACLEFGSRAWGSKVACVHEPGGTELQEAVESLLGCAPWVPQGSSDSEGFASVRGQKRATTRIDVRSGRLVGCEQRVRLISILLAEQRGAALGGCEIGRISH